MTVSIFLSIYLAFVTVFGIFMITVYVKKYKHLPVDVWKPGAAWTRALIYFSFCNIFIVTSGTLEQLIIQPLFTTEQITNTLWVVYCIFCFIYAFFAYWILWSRMTLTFDRKYYLTTEILFGILWGFSTGGLLLSFSHLWSLTGSPFWVRYLLSFVTVGIWQYFIQDYFWDVYVSPEHDTPKSILIKTLVSHIPNMAISLGFLIIWGNYLLFVSIYIIALVASTIFQRFPAPWAKEKFHAPMTKSGIGGLLRGAGYLEDINKSRKN
jgi:hypothetical protein